MRNIFKNHHLKNNNNKHTTVFASLSIFLHSSHVKLALKTSASTSMVSNAGFMLAFCPRRLFNIIIFMQKKHNFLKIFSFFFLQLQVDHATQKQTKSIHLAVWASLEKKRHQQFQFLLRVFIKKINVGRERVQIRKNFFQ